MKIYPIWQGSFIRFLLIGIVNTCVGLSLTFILYHGFEMGYWLATFLGNALGGVNSYILNRRFTFRSSASIHHSWWKFLIVTLCCYILSFRIGLSLFSWIGTFYPEITQSVWDNAAILVGSGLYMVSNYLGHRFYTFKS